MSNKDIKDLQIYIARSPSSPKINHEQIPIYLSERRVAHQIYRTNENDMQQSASQNHDTNYIIIANSTVVENNKLSISIEEIIKMNEKLFYFQQNTTIFNFIEFGQKIFDFIFCGRIRDLFRKISSESKILRVTITTIAPELIVLPWELLCDTKLNGAPYFISQAPNIYLCRSLEIFDRKEFKFENLPEKEKLKLLLITANPDSSGFLDFDTEERQLNFIINSEPYLDNVIFETLHNANVNNVRAKIIQFKPDIIHTAPPAE